MVARMVPCKHFLVYANCIFKEKPWVWGIEVHIKIVNCKGNTILRIFKICYIVTVLRKWQYYVNGNFKNINNIICDGKKVGGLILKIDKETHHNELEILFTLPEKHSKDIEQLKLILKLHSREVLS